MKKKLQDGGPVFKGSPKSDKKVLRKVKKTISKVYDDINNESYKEQMSKKKMQAGGVVKSQPKRVGPVDPDGAYTKVQERTLAGAKVKKVPLTKDKELGATKMKKGGDVAKKSVIKKAQLGSSINPRIDSRVKRINERTDKKVENYETRVGKKYMKDPSSLPAPGRSREIIDKGNEKVAKIRRRANAKRGW